VHCEFPELRRFFQNQELWVARSWQRCNANMHVLCAWCCRDGQPAYLGEREPLENPAPTHGLCVRHKEQLLEALPSTSFPDAELLIVVRRNDTALGEHLQQSFAALPRVKVIVDRRVGDRRSAQCPVPDERRRRRTRRIRQGTLFSLGGYTFVRFTPK
jgi:hypothetical protein